MSNAPPATPPPSYYANQPYPYAPARPTNGLAIASLVLGLVWCFGLGSLLAVIFGHVAKRQIKESGGAQTGGGMATAGLVLGWLGLAMFALTMLVMILAAASSAGSSY